MMSGKDSTSSHDTDPQCTLDDVNHYWIQTFLDGTTAFKATRCG